jgi:hypothetical protein
MTWTMVRVCPLVCIGGSNAAVYRQPTNAASAIQTSQGDDRYLQNPIRILRGSVR